MLSVPKPMEFANDVAVAVAIRRALSGLAHITGEGRVSVSLRCSSGCSGVMSVGPDADALRGVTGTKPEGTAHGTVEVKYVVFGSQELPAESLVKTIEAVRPVPMKLEIEQEYSTCSSSVPEGAYRPDFDHVQVLSSLPASSTPQPKPSLVNATTYVVEVAFSIYHLDLERLDEAQQEDLKGTLAYHLANAGKVATKQVVSLQLTMGDYAKRHFQAASFRVDATIAVPADVLPTFVQRSLMGTDGSVAISKISQDIQLMAGVQGAMTTGHLVVSPFHAMVAQRGRLESQVRAQRELDDSEDKETEEVLSSAEQVVAKRLQKAVEAKEALKSHGEAGRPEQASSGGSYSSWHDWMEEMDARAMGFLLPMSLAVVVTVPVAMFFGYICVQLPSQRRHTAHFESVPEGPDGPSASCSAAAGALSRSSKGEQA